MPVSPTDDDSSGSRDRSPSPDDSGADAPPDPGEVQDVISAETNASPIGLDTVTCKVEDFCIETDASLDLGAPPEADTTGAPDPETLEVHEVTDLRTGVTTDGVLLRMCDGSVAPGSKATLNAERFQVTVYGPDCLLVECSLPKVLWGHNSVPASTPAHVDAALDALRRGLKAEGIRADVRSAPIANLHICRNVQTDAPIQAYEEPLKRYELPYLEPRDNGYAGVKWSSKQSSGRSQRELTFYARSDDSNHDRSHLQRLEYRLQRKRVVQSEFGELRASDLSRRLSDVRTCFRDMVRALLPDADALPAPEPHPDEAEPTDAAQPTADDLTRLLAEIRARHGDGCHRLSRLAWALLWLLSPDPRRLSDALQRAAGGPEGPAGGKYAAREKVKEARRVVQAIDPTLRSDRARLASLRQKLLA